MLLSERKTAFSDPAWMYELKFDGYRMLAEVDAGRCILRSRSGADATTWFPEVVIGLAQLPGHHVRISAIVDAHFSLIVDGQTA